MPKEEGSGSRLRKRSFDLPDDTIELLDGLCCKTERGRNAVTRRLIEAAAKTVREAGGPDQEKQALESFGLL